MSPLDWGVLAATLGFFIAWGVWRGRGERDLGDYLLAGRAMPWWAVALSVMATQASAVTFLSTPGQGYADGLRFVQFYFGLPLAMIVLCVSVVPRFHRMKVFTAYEYLERRFDGKTRTLATALFLVQRGLAAGITIYAPALVLSVILGWPLTRTTLLLGALAVAYTVSGGSKAVTRSHALQFSIIMGTMVVAFVTVLHRLPAGVGAGDALGLAGRLGRLHALVTHFDPNDRYTLWSGLIGGFFLQLAYFGTDQSQVGRYLTGRSIAQSRLGLVVNGLVKVPMQLFILSLGVLVFVFHLFQPAPPFANPEVTRALAAGPHAARYHALEAAHRDALATRAEHARAWVAAHHAHAAAAAARASDALRADQERLGAVRAQVTDLIRTDDPAASTSDTNYVFLSFVLAQLPLGLIGLVFAAVFAAAMNASSAELNALASTTVVDIVRRVRPGVTEGRRGVWISRAATLMWAMFAVGFAEGASRLGSLIEAVNILGSLFYGTILGIFLTAFYLPRVRGSAVFAAALIAEALVLACFRFTGLSFLWYNLIGCAAVMVVAALLELVTGARPSREARAA